MKILFMGTPAFAVPTLEALLASPHEVIGVVTQPDAPAGRGRKLRPPAVKVRALEAGLPLYQPDKPRRALWPDLSPDLIVVVAYGHILPREILDWPARGCVNLHASLLPRYRGAAPIHWAIIEGETETGVTSIRMSERMDAGDVLLQKRCAIAEDDTTETLSEKLARLGAEVCRETLDALEE
ncbi:MAG: methionyl-tRNA formyltransferase, partial [Nitrospinota bacterium]